MSGFRGNRRRPAFRPLVASVRVLGCRSVVVAVVFAAATTTTALGQGGDSKEWRRGLRQIGKREAAYWAAFDNRFREAATAWYEPVRVQKHTGDNEPVLDYRQLHLLFADLRSLEEQRAGIYRRLAETDLPRCTEILHREMEDTLDSIEKTEKDLAELKIRKWRGILDQRPAFRREVLAQRQETLQALLAQRSKAATFLSQSALPQAKRKDPRRGFPIRQIAVLDTLAATGAAEASAAIVPYLDAKSVPLRVTAVEALMRMGGVARLECVPLVEDEALPVRRALLDALATDDADKRWTKVLVRAYLGSHGLFRRDCIRTLQRLTGYEVGDQPEFWRKLAESIEGTGPAPVAPTTTDPGRSSRFYGVALVSDRVLFLLEGSFSFTVPAEYEIQRTRPFMEWGTWGRADWKKKHFSHQQVLAEQLGAALDSAPPDTRFRIAMMGHPGNARDRVVTYPRESDRLLPVSPRNRRRAVEFVADHKVAFVHDLHLGLMKALEWPGHDTVYLFCNGEIGGGRIILPGALLADFQRKNRFRRLVVHVIRVCQKGKQSESLLKGIAAASGGAYEWSKAPPK